jgi:hypothetical protein
MVKLRRMSNHHGHRAQVMQVSLALECVWRGKHCGGLGTGTLKTAPAAARDVRIVGEEGVDLSLLGRVEPPV